MAKGFFAPSKITSRRKTGMIAHCGSCGLYKHCKSPKMPPTGKGKKKILVVAEAPGKNEDRDNTQLHKKGKSGKIIRRQLSLLGSNLDIDFIKTNAVICRPRNNKKPEDYMIAACRPNLMKTIKEYKPNVILLLGEVAVKSLLTEAWGGEIGRISRWSGFCIPCREPNAWIIPTFHPSYIGRANNKMLNRIFKEHLKLAIKKSKNKPWDEIPDYEKQVEIITRPSQAAKLIREFAKKGGKSSVDYETNCLKPEGEGTEIVSCSICWRGRRTISYPWAGEAIDATSEFLKSPAPKIAANLKMEDKWTRVKLGHPVSNWFWDTVIAAHVIDNRPGITSLKFQAFVLLGMESYNSHIESFLKQKKGSRFNRIFELDLNDLLLYGGLDSYLPYWVTIKQIQLLKKKENDYD